MVWQKLWLLLTTKETVFATETHVIYVRERVCLCSTAFIGFASQKKEAGLKSTSFSCAALYMVWYGLPSTPYKTLLLPLNGVAVKAVQIFFPSQAPFRLSKSGNDTKGFFVGYHPQFDTKLSVFH